MIKKSVFYKVLSAVHIVFFTSILCFGIMFLSGLLLMLPALCAAFQIGKAAMYDELDITNSIVLSFFRYFKQALCLERFVPVNFIMLLNLAGMYFAANVKSTWMLLACLVIFSLLLTLCLFIAGYATFVENKFLLEEVAVAMLVKPLSVVTVFILMLLLTYFFSGVIAAILVLMGTFFLFVIELVIFMTMLQYRQLSGKLDEGDKYAYMLDRKSNGEK
ncbi:MAG: hypothetical protein K2M91_05830 [Lachnospiraceae bacterium]|nr:hypothetical protein [Lachnospiraceae bacterium]